MARVTSHYKGVRHGGYGKGKAQLALLRVGLEQVDRYGMVDLSLRDLQRRAETSESTAFKGFENKLAFVCRLSDQAAFKLYESLDTAQEGRGVSLREAIADWVRALHQKPGLAALAFAKPAIHGKFNRPNNGFEPLDYTARVIVELLRRENPDVNRQTLYGEAINIVTKLLGYSLLVAHDSRYTAEIPDPVAFILDGVPRESRTRGPRPQVEN